MLDPRISYSGLKKDYSENTELLPELETAKKELEEYFRAHYIKLKDLNVIQPETDSQASTLPDTTTSSKYNLLEGYDDDDDVMQDELEDYFRFTLKREPWTRCDPISWWHTQRHKFPNLYILARNMLAIPGKLYRMSKHIYLN